MLEITPEKGSNPAQTPEQAAQHSEALYEELTTPKPEASGIRRRGETQAEKEHLMDAASPMIGQPRTETPTPNVHEEPGYKMLEKIPDDQLKIEVNKLITVKADLEKPGEANSLQEKMAKLYEQAQK